MRDAACPLSTRGGRRAQARGAGGREALRKLGAVEVALRVLTLEGATWGLVSELAALLTKLVEIPAGLTQVETSSLCSLLSSPDPPLGD